MVASRKSPLKFSTKTGIQLALILHHVEGIELVVGLYCLGVTPGNRVSKLGLNISHVFHVFGGIATGFDRDIHSPHKVTTVQRAVDAVIG